jgi:hypothetical protein
MRSAVRTSRDDVRTTAMQLLAMLEQERARLNQEIASYPTPIPRCDAQFNFLYERRGALTACIVELRDAVAIADVDDDGAALARIAAGAACTANPHERELRARLRGAVGPRDDDD